MSKAYIVDINRQQKIIKKPQLVARLSVPKGKYIISGKMYVQAIVNGRRFDYDQIFNCKLICGKTIDEANLSLNPRLPSGFSTGDQRPYWVDKLSSFHFHGGFDTVIPFSLGVNLETSEHIDMSIFSVNEGGVMVSRAIITALEVDELSISTEFSENENELGRVFHGFGDYFTQPVRIHQLSVFRRIWNWIVGD